MRTSLSLVQRGVRVFWPIDEITHFSFSDKYATAHRTNGSVLIADESLKTLETEFPGVFTRTHRSHLVATRLITEVRYGFVMVEGVGKVPVSRRLQRSVAATKGGPL